MNRIKRFVKERDKALLSMDVEKIRSYAKKYDIPCPKDEKVVLAGAAKAILQINSASDEQKSKAGRWLLDNGFTLDIH